MPWSISNATIITPKGKQQHLDIPPFNAMQYLHCIKQTWNFVNTHNRKLIGTLTQILISSTTFKIFFDAVVTFINVLEMRLESIYF